MHPGLTINSMTYRGYLDGSDIFDAICSSFTKLPKVCNDISDETFSSANEPKNEDNRKKRVRRFVATILLIFLLALQIGFFLWYRQQK